MSEIAPPPGLTLLVVVGGREYEIVEGFASLQSLEEAVTTAVRNGEILVLTVFRQAVAAADARPARGTLVVDGRRVADLAALAVVEIEAGKPGIDGAGG